MVSLDIVRSEPGVFKALLRGNSLGWVLFKHFLDEVLGGVGDSVPVCWVECQRLFEDVAENLLIVVSFKRRVTTEEDEEDDTKTPDVALEVVVSLEDLRGDIVGSSNDCLHAAHFLFAREAL